MSYSLGWAVLLIVVVSQSRRSISKFRGPCLSAKDTNIEVPQVLEYVYIRFNLGIIVFFILKLWDLPLSKYDSVLR